MALNLKSPKSDKEFKEYWSIFIDDISQRDNLKPGHLKQLEILCDMYVEYGILSDDILLRGHTYESGGDRHGIQVKIRPEVQQMNKLRSEMRAYSQMLGLTLVKDTIKTKGETEEESW